MGKIIKKLNIIMLILVVIAIIKPISAKALDYWDIYKDSDGKYFKNEIATSLRNSGYLRYGKSSQVSLAWPRDVDGNGSDYNDYIPKYGGIWCLNEADNGSGKLSIQEILTIIGGGVYSDRYNISNNTDDTIDAAKFAYAIEYIDEYNNYPNYGHKGGFWTAFYNNWKSKNGKKLYANTAIQTIFGHGMYNAKTLGSSEKININGTQMTQSAYATSVSNLYKNLSCNSTAQMIEGQFKDTHKSTWDYKITGINLEWNWGNSLVAKRQIQIGDTKYTVKYSDTYETWYIHNSNNSKVGRIVRTSNDAKGYIYYGLDYIY